jgi:uncharacterized protein
VPGELLLDTGAFVALLDSSEARHNDCVTVLSGWTGPLLTTEAVVTETMYLVGPGWRPQKACMKFFLRSAALLVPSSRASLQRVTELMEKYRDVPMDFADGTLVALGEEAGTDQVFTLDRKGFSTYRLRGKKVFRIVP